MLDTISSSPAAPWVHLDIPNRMAVVIRRVRLIGGEERATLEDFKREVETCDLSEADLRENIGAAARLVVTGEAEPTYDREGRIAAAAALVLGLMPQVAAIHTVLRQAKFLNAEIADIWDDVVARSAADFQAHRGTPKSPGLWGRDILERNAN